MNSTKNQRSRGDSGGSKSKLTGMGKMNMPRRDNGLAKKDCNEITEMERYPKDEL